MGISGRPAPGKPPYETGYKPEEIGASYHKMVKEVRECLANLDTDSATQGAQDRALRVRLVPRLERHVPARRQHQATGLRRVLSELRASGSGSARRVQGAEVASRHGELGVGGEKADKNMMDFRAGQAKIATCPELKGTLGYVRTAPFWYPELDELPRKMEAEESRVRRRRLRSQGTAQRQGESPDPKKLEESSEKPATRL